VAGVQPKASSQATPAAATTNTASSSRQRPPLFNPDSDSSDEEQDRDTSKSRMIGETGFGAPTLLVQDVSEDVEMDQTVLENNANGADLELDTSDNAAMDVDEVHPTSEADARVDQPLVTRAASPTVTQTMSPSNDPMTLPREVPLASVPKALSKPAERQIPRIQAPRASSSHRTRNDSGQLVLSTAGASWNLRPPSPSNGASPADSRPRKRARVEDDSGTRIRSSDVIVTDKIVEKGFKLRMAGYVMPGSQTVADAGSSSSDEDEMDVSGGPVQALNAVERSGSEDVSAAASPSTAHSVSLSPSKASMNSSEVTGTEASVNAEILRPNTSRRRPNKSLLSGVHVSEIPSSGVGSSITPEYVRSTPLYTTQVCFDEQAMMQRWAERPMTASTTSNGTFGHVSTAQVDCDDVEATETLSRVISKVDFANMEVIGQFNLGFIIARRRDIGSSTTTPGSSSQESAKLEPPKDDLFIIDQHAADEKYNFEQLQLTTRIESQALFK
jgi:DNA mismatch repair protein PMS2